MKRSAHVNKKRRVSSKEVHNCALPMAKGGSGTNMAHIHIETLGTMTIKEKEKEAKRISQSIERKAVGTPGIMQMKTPSGTKGGTIATRHDEDTHRERTLEMQS